MSNSAEWDVVLENTCTCSNLYKCEECFTDWYDGDEQDTCPDCGSQDISETPGYEVCDGTCWKDSLAVQEDLMESKFDPGNSWVFIGGKNMGWQNLSGYTLVDVDDFDYKSVAIDGDFTQRWRFNSDNTVTVMLSHHDSPTGETYEVKPASIGQVINYFGAEHQKCPSFDHNSRPLTEDDSDVYDAQERLLSHLLPISESAANVYEKNTEILTAPVEFFVERWKD